MKQIMKNIFIPEREFIGDFIFMWIGIVMSILCFGLIAYGAITGQLVAQ
jgi:hypothetical protein